MRTMRVLALTVAAGFGAAHARAQEIGSAVQRALETDGWVPVVVMLRPAASAGSALAERTSAVSALQSGVLDALGPADFRLTRRWSAIPGFAGQLSAAGQARLRAHPSVLRVDMDEAGEGHLGQSVPLVRADAVHALGYTGRWVEVAVLDSGVDRTHADLADAVLEEQCFCTNGDGTGCCPGGGTSQSGPGAAADGHGHGTNVTGIVASSGTVAAGGVAPSVGIVAVKVLDDLNRFFGAAQVLSGLDWVIANRPDVRVVNMSLGTNARFAGYCDGVNAFTMAFAAAIDALHARGTTVFVSSGNARAVGSLPAPACIANALSVGAVYDSNVGQVNVFGCTDATTAADRVTCFSNTDVTLDLLGPGAPITSSGPGGGTLTFYGTSQAAPHAAGIAALLLEINPALTAAQVETALEVNGVAVADPRVAANFPRVDALASVNAVLAESDLIFRDGFESADVSAWSGAVDGGGDLSVSMGAALAGTGFGLQCPADGADPLYVRDETPRDENRYRARFYFDPSDFDPGEAAARRRVRLLIALEESPQRRLLAVVLRRLLGQYSLMARVRQDDNTQVQTAFIPITPDPHFVEVDWRRATTSSANDGGVDLWIDGAAVATVTGVDNATGGIDLVRFGLLSPKVGATGTLLLDEYESRRRSFIGPD